MRVGINKDQIEDACKIFSEWARIKEENGQSISAADIDHSSLLRRLLAGIPPHINPPPKRYGYPCWDLVEKDEVQVQSIFVTPQYGWVVVDQDNGYRYVGDPKNNIIKYERLDIYFQIIKKEVIPPPELCAKKYKDCPEKLKYMGTFLRRVGQPPWI